MARVFIFILAILTFSCAEKKTDKYKESRSVSLFDVSGKKFLRLAEKYKVEDTLNIFKLGDEIMNNNLNHVLEFLQGRDSLTKDSLLAICSKVNSLYEKIDVADPGFFRWTKFNTQYWSLEDKKKYHKPYYRSQKDVEFERRYVSLNSWISKLGEEYDTKIFALNNLSTSIRIDLYEFMLQRITGKKHVNHVPIWEVEN